MNHNEAARLAGAVNLLRPEWPTTSLQTFITDKLGTRPYRDAAVALAYVACDPTSKTPARVLEAGPWWKVGDEDREPIRARKCVRCSEFHIPNADCRPARGNVTSKHSAHVTAAREAVRDGRGNRKCEHGVRTIECEPCTEGADA